MMDIVPFAPEHLEFLTLQRSESELQVYLSNQIYRRSLANKYAYTAMIDGEPVGSCGILPKWSGRAEAWALLSPGFNRHMFLKAHLYVRKILDICHLDGFKRIESTVDEDFEAGHRWMKALGFRREGPGESIARSYSPEGRNHIRYERIAG